VNAITGFIVVTSITFAVVVAIVIHHLTITISHGIAQ
jgi:hypothetical protein